MTHTFMWLALVPLACVASCRAPANASRSHEPGQDLAFVEAQVLERSRERLRLMSERSWESVYEFFHPEVRRALALDEFIASKEAHSYGEGDVTVRAGAPYHAFAQVAVQWAPSWSMRMVPIRSGKGPSGRSTRSLEPRTFNGNTWELIEFVETWDLYLGQWYLDWPPLRPALWQERHPGFEWASDTASGM